MIYIVIGLAVVVAVIIAMKYSKARSLQRMLFRIRKQFGSVPDREFILKNVQYLVDCEEKKYDIDEITWNDLDMDKVYSRINNCNSFVGEQVLYRQLHSLEHKGKETETRENLIQGFMDDTKRREDVQLMFEGLGRHRNSYYLPQFIKEIDMFKLSNIWIYRILTILLGTTLVLGIFNQYFLYACGAIFLINLVIYTLGKYRFEFHLGMLGSVVDVVVTANTLIKKYNINESDLAKESILSAERMSKTVNRIAIIQRKMETGMIGDIGALIFNYLIGSTLWDFHIFHKIVTMLTIHQEEFMKLYNYIGEIDAAISIASYRESIPYYCKPVFQKDKTIYFEEMYHPLINEPVSNDVDMKSNYIVTGSNASGKSTYIKAIAINMILAQSINMTLAKSANIPYANVLTSMAVRDDVTSGESYYMREIKYLKRIITQLKEDKLTLCIVDEILRGTNTEERIAASVAILNYIYTRNCLAIVASHDIEISERLGKKFMNCHFSEAINKKDIYFDYKVKEGVSKSKNAIKLLRHVGFPKEIVKSAEELVLKL